MAEMSKENRLIDANDGYIKKSDAVDALWELMKKYRRSAEKCAVGGCILKIRELPTAEAAEVVHGRWLSWEEKWKGNAFMNFGKKKLGVICTACGMYADNTFDYCPNCGAKMDGVDEDG